MGKTLGYSEKNMGTAYGMRSLQDGFTIHYNSLTLKNGDSLLPGPIRQSQNLCAAVCV